MDEKLKKALRTSKQGVWALLILLVLVGGLGIIGAGGILEYLQAAWTGIIFMGALIAGLVLYGKGKYTTGAEVIQWAGLGNIILTVFNIVITYAITGVFLLAILLIIPTIIGLLLAIVLIVDALKVIRLTEEPGHVNKVTIPAIIVITVVIIINIVTTVQAKQELDDILDGIKDQINNEVVNKDDKEDTNKEETNNDNEENNEQEDNKQDETEDKEDEEGKIDPYANYKNMTWAGTTASSGIGITANISNKTVVLKYSNKKTEYTMNENLKKVYILLGANPYFYVITESGKVYAIEDAWIALNENREIKEVKQLKKLAGTKIIDMTSLEKCTQESGCANRIYFLTNDGKLIDEEGEYYKTNATVDPYANYKNITWATTKVRTFYIKNNKLYATLQKEEVWRVPGTPEKLMCDEKANGIHVYVITKEEKVYEVYGDNHYIQILPKENIIDMTHIDNHGQEYNYYLTEDGKLIDKNGVSFSESRFTDSFELNVMIKISIDKNLHGFYYNGKTYSEIKDSKTGKAIDIEQIYSVNNADLALIISGDKLYEYDGRSNNAVPVAGEVVAITQDDGYGSGDRLLIVLEGDTTADRTNKEYKDDGHAYDFIAKKEIDTSKLPTYILWAANDAAKETSLLTARNACTLAWMDAVRPESNGVATDANGKVVTAEYYYDYLAANGFGTKAEIKQIYKITVDSTNGTATVEEIK